MKPTRHLISSLVVGAVALAGLTACGPEDDSAGGANGDHSASSVPSSGQTAAGHSSNPADGGCGTPPKQPAGHKMVEPAAPPSKGSMSASGHQRVLMQKGCPAGSVRTRALSRCGW